MPSTGEGAPPPSTKKAARQERTGMSLADQSAPLIVMWRRLKPHQNGVWLTKQGGRKNRDFALPQKSQWEKSSCRV